MCITEAQNTGIYIERRGEIEDNGSLITHRVCWCISSQLDFGLQRTETPSKFLVRTKKARRTDPRIQRDQTVESHCRSKARILGLR